MIYVQIIQPFGMGYYPAYDYHYSLLPVNHTDKSAGGSGYIIFSYFPLNLCMSLRMGDGH